MEGFYSYADFYGEQTVLTVQCLLNRWEDPMFSILLGKEVAYPLHSIWYMTLGVPDGKTWITSRMLTSNI